jgi:hypothetical protein
LQKVPAFQVVQGLWEKEEGQGQRTPKEHLLPLQEIPLKEAPLYWPRKVHVEQEVHGLPLQVDMQLDQSGVQTPPHFFGRIRQVCQEGEFRKQLMVCGAGG